MRNRRIRVSLGAWMIAVAVVSAGIAIAMLVMAAKRKEREARVECIDNLRALGMAVKGDFSVDSRLHPDGSVLTLCSYELVASACPLAQGTNRTLANSYDLHEAARTVCDCFLPRSRGRRTHNAYHFAPRQTSPPTCRIRPEEHMMP